MSGIRTALLADDELTLREHLKDKLQRFWPELEIVAEVDNGIDALEYVQALRPDVAFLDIRMPGLSGMRVAQQLAASTHIVFVTAYDQYAVDAFNHNAVDYLLKPYSDERLQETIRRLKAREDTATDGQRLQSMLSQLAQQPVSGSRPLQWIRASVGGDVSLIHLDDVIFFQSGDKYTTVCTANVEYLIRTPLKELEATLDSEQFWRVHRSFIVNVAYIDKARRTIDGRYSLTLKECDKRVDVSRAYSHLFKQM